MGGNETRLQIIVDAVNETGSAFASIGSNLDAVKSQTASLREGMLAVGVAGTAVFAGMSLVAKSAIEAGANFEQTTIAFNTMIGNASLAQKTLADLTNFAASTPFQLTQIQTAAEQLLAYGVSAQELIPTLKTLGDIAAGVGMDKLPELILAFGQVQAKGHLAGQELLQFTNAGVGLAQQIQKDLGLTRDQFEKLMAAGQISAAQVTKALNEMSGQGGLFYNLMAKQTDSLAGQWSNFKDQLNLTAVAIGTQLLPYLKPLVESLIEVIKHVQAFATEHPKLSAFLLMATLGFSALAALMLPLAIALPGLIVMFGALGGAIAAVTAISAPMLLVIGGLIAAMTVLAANGYTTKKAWEEVWLGIQVIAADAANAVIGTIESMINFVISGVNQAIEAINKVLLAAQKIPGVGNLIPTLSTISTVNLGRINTDTIAASSLSQSAAPGTKTTTVAINNPVFLSKDAASDIGDMIIKKLQLSSAV